MKKLQTSKDGLSGTEAARRLKEYGPNVVAREARHSHLRLLGKALINPLVILLLVIAASSFLTGDFRAGIVVVGIILGVGVNTMTLAFGAVAIPVLSFVVTWIMWYVLDDY